MTRDEAREAARVMLAYANGAEVEGIYVNPQSMGKHFHTDIPSFNWQVFNYRVKREPRVLWVGEQADGVLMATNFTDKLECEMKYSRAVKMQEVLE